MARPTKLDDQLQTAICDYIGEGLTFADACRLVDISTTTFSNWRERGESEEEPFLSFLEAVKVAEARFKKTHLKTIAVASINQWQAAAWLLERKYPAEFALRQQIAVSDKLEQFIKAFDEIK